MTGAKAYETQIAALQQQVADLQYVVDELIRYDALDTWALQKGLYPQQRKIICYLVRRRAATKDQLCTLLWGDDPDGGPPAADIGLRTTIWQLRQKLKPFDVRIESATGRYWLTDENRSRLVALAEVPEAGE